MSTSGAQFRWQERRFTPMEDRDTAETQILAADSWLVNDGQALAINLHRDRFFAAVEQQLPGSSSDLGLVEFWDAALDAIPRTGSQFPRVELQLAHESPLLVMRQRPAPELRLSAAVATHLGPDPRRQPTLKGPDGAALLLARAEAQKRGADEAVIVSPEGFVVEGTNSGILWWRGDILCAPSPELERVDSITARSVIALATALGVDVFHESLTPDDIDGREVWVLSALHGIRIVTSWLDGPAMAEEPDRLRKWRARLDRLRKPLPPASAR